MLVGLKRGFKGLQVRKLQHLLNYHLSREIVAKTRARLAADGDFGPATQGAVRQFQILTGLMTPSSPTEQLGVVTTETALALLNFRRVRAQVLGSQNGRTRNGGVGFGVASSFGFPGLPPLQTQQQQSKSPFALSLKLAPGLELELPEKSKTEAEWKSIGLTLEGTYLVPGGSPGGQLQAGFSVEGANVTKDRQNQQKVTGSINGEFSSLIFGIGERLTIDYFAKIDVEATGGSKESEFKLSFLSGAKLGLELIPERLSVETEFGMGLVGWDIAKMNLKAGAVWTSELNLTLLKFPQG